MLANILDQVIKTYGKEFLGDWDPINNFRIDSLTDPEIHLTNIPFPQQLFELAEIPFAVDFSNIAKVRAKFSWQTFFGSPGAYPFAIEAEDLEVRIRLLYPSEWNSEFWRNKILKAKLKRAALWEKFASLLGSAQGDRSSVAQTIEPRIVNSLAIRVRNIHVHIVDDNLGATPWAFECHVDEFCIDSPKRGDPRISDMEATGLEQCLLMGLWMRFVGMHFWYREFDRPQLEGKAGVSVNIDKARELRRRLRRNPGDEEAQRLLSNLLGMDAQAAGAASASTEATAGEATPAPAAAPASEASDRGAKGTGLHPDLQRLEQQGAASGVGVDAGTLTSMLSKEIQETLQIKDQSVSLSLASRVLQWGWWCGKPPNPEDLRPLERTLTPLSAETVLGAGTGEAGSHPDEDTEDAPCASAATPAPENPVVAAAAAAASAQAAADAAALAKHAAAAALRRKEDSDSGSKSTASSEEEEDLLSGVRASKAFKVVPSQIKNLLDANTHAFRVTPKKGIEMHILFKKWELRALGSSLAVNKQSWKSVELSFLHHDPSLYSPLPSAASSAGQQQERTCQQQEKRREPPPPVFDGSTDHRPLQLTLTSAALGALFNFVKLIDVWFVFMKGAARPTRLVAREDECATYVEMWKRRLTAKPSFEKGELLNAGLRLCFQAEMRDVVERFITDFEYSSPLYLILKLRQMAEDTLTWRDGVSAAVLQKQILGRFSETCCRPEHLGSLQWATGETGETRIDGLERGTGDLTDKERLLLDDIAYTVDEASGDERGGFGGKRWFFIDGILSVIVPNLSLRFLPLIQPGMHIAYPDHLTQDEPEQQPERPLLRHGTLALLDRLETRQSVEREPPALNPRLPHTTLMFRICTDFKFRQEKRNDFFKCHDIFIDSVFIEKGFAALRAKPCSEATSLRAPHNADQQTPLPELMVSAGSLARMGCSTCVYMPADPPSRLGWGLGPARPPLRGRVVEPASSVLRELGGYTDYDMISKDELFRSPLVSDRNSGHGHITIGPIVQAETPTEADDGSAHGSPRNQHLLSQRIRPSRVYSNIHAFFDRARHLADIVKKGPRRATKERTIVTKRRGSIGGDKNRTIFISISSKMVWDEELEGPLEKKKTWINIPEISITAPELIPLAGALPMSFVTWDLFKQKDCLIPATTDEAMGLALGYCPHVDSSLRFSAQKATVIYRLSSLDYSRVLSHVRRDAIAEARDLQQRAAAEAAAAAARAAAAGTGRFGDNSWEGAAAVSDGGTPSSSSMSSMSTVRGRWRQRGWAERAAAAAAAGKPLAFLGERWLDGRREFEAQRRMISSGSSSSPSLPSDVHSFSDSFLSPTSSEALQAPSGPSGAGGLQRADLDSHPRGTEHSEEVSEDDTFAEDSINYRVPSFGSTEGSVSEMDFEPVEAHGFTSSCRGLKASITTLRLNQTVKKRKSFVAADALNLSIEAAEAAVLAQPPGDTVMPSTTTDCTVLSVFDVNVGTTKAPQQKVNVSVGRLDLGVSTQLVALAACRSFLMPASFPYSSALRDTETLKLKLAQLGSLQRKTPASKARKAGPAGHQQQHHARPAAGEGQQTGSPASLLATGVSKGATMTPPEGEAGDDVGMTAFGPATDKEPRAEDTPNVPEAFLPVPTTGPWAECDGSRLDWFFTDTETAQKFTSDLPPLKFVGPGQENKDSYQRWRVARNRRANGKEVPLPLSSDGACGAAAAGTAAPANDAMQKPLQVSAKVGCICIGLYTQQQYLALLLRVYAARVQLRRKNKDIRLKAKLGELFVEHLKVRGTQRRSIVLCKRVVHIGAQCRRFPSLTGLEAPASPIPSSRELHPASLVSSEMRQWSAGSRYSSEAPSPTGRIEPSGAMQLQVPVSNEERRYLSSSSATRRGNLRGRGRGIDGTTGVIGSSSIRAASGPEDGQLPKLRQQMLQYPKRRLLQEARQPGGRWRQKDREELPRSGAFLQDEQLHRARRATIEDKADTSQRQDKEQEPAVDAEGPGETEEALPPEASMADKDKEKGSLRMSFHHGLYCRGRSNLLPGQSGPPEDSSRRQEKPRFSEFLRQSRSRLGGTSNLRQQNQHRGRGSHWSSGGTEDASAEEAINALTGGSASDSSLDDVDRLYGVSAVGEANGIWRPDVVGDWTLRAETDGEDIDVVKVQQPPTGHECCFGVPDAPLNLLLFDDKGSKRRFTHGRRRRTENDGEAVSPSAKPDKSSRRDQVSLSLRLEPETKTTQAQLNLQSLHAFPTANLLCCLTDATLCLKTLWDEESIRSRCLFACVSGDARSQRAAHFVGLNLQPIVETESKRATKRHFTLNRRMQHQHRADKYSSRGSGGSTETSSYSSTSVPPGGLSRGTTALRKQAKTTFSRWGPPEGFLDTGSSFPSGIGPADATRRYSRSLSGGRRRRRSFVPSPTKDKSRSVESSPIRDPGAARAGTITTIPPKGSESPADIRSFPQPPPVKSHSPSASSKDTSGKQPAAEGREGAAGSGVFVSVELVLEDVTCNLLTDDAAGMQAAREVDLIEGGSTDSAAGGSPRSERDYDFAGLMNPSTFAASQLHQEKPVLLHGRRRYDLQAFSTNSSNNSNSIDAKSTVSTASTDNGAGGDAGLAFPPFPVLFSPDLCVPPDDAAEAGALGFDSPLRRAVVADAAALGVRLEAALRVTYTSVPTNSSTSRKREELKDTLRVGLWRLEATLIRNCTWALASAVFFDLNLRAECLRLLPPKKKRSAIGAAKSSGPSRTYGDMEPPDRRFSQLQAVPEGESGEDEDTARALQRTLWSAERGESPGRYRGSQRWSSLKPWDQKAGSSMWPDGYASGEGSVHPGGYGKNTRNLHGSLDAGFERDGARRGVPRHLGSYTESEALRTRLQSITPRRVPSNASSSFFRWVFGTRTSNPPPPAVSSAAESSPHDDLQPMQATYWRRRSAGDTGRGDRRAGETYPKHYTDGEPDIPASLTDAAAYGRQPRQAEKAAATTSATPLVRRRASSVAWPRNLLRSRRTSSTFNSTDGDRVPSPPARGREVRKFDRARSEAATVSGDLSSPSALHAGGRARQQPRANGNVSQPLPARRAMRALSAMDSERGHARNRTVVEDHQKQERAPDLKAKAPRPSAGIAANAAAALRKERRAEHAAALQRKEWEDEREFLTCTAIDLEIKRVAVWSAVYLQDNKAAANPCRASAAAFAAPKQMSREPGGGSGRYGSGAGGHQVAGAEADSREVDRTTGEDSRLHSGPHEQRFGRHRIPTATRKVPSSGMHLHANEGSGGGGISSPATGDTPKPEARATGQHASRSRITRAAQEAQHLTSLLKEVWAEDWLSVSLPSPPPFAGYFREQEGRVLLLPVLLRASTKNERSLLQRRLKDTQSALGSAARSQEKSGSSAERRGFPAAADASTINKLCGLPGTATAAAVAAAFSLHNPVEKEKTAAAERLRGAANVSPHISVMYRLMDDNHSPPSTPHQMLSYPGPDAHATETKIVCRADVFPTFCACTPFLVNAYTRLFGKEGEMTAVLSRLSMGLQAIRVGMQKQQQTASESAKAVGQFLPNLTNTSEDPAAATSPSPNAGAKGGAAAQQQRQEGSNGHTQSTPTSGTGTHRGSTAAPGETPEEAALLVDRRLWGALPGSLLQLGFALRAALERLSHDAFVSLCIHSLQVTLPSPCQLLGLPAVPATSRVLPITAVRPTLTSDAFYFICCLAAAPNSPCAALDLVLTLKGLRKHAQLLTPQAQLQQQRWSATAAPTMGAVGPNWAYKFDPSQADARGLRPYTASVLQLQPNQLASPSAAGGAVGPAAGEGTVAVGAQQEAALGSVKVTAPLLRLELLRKPRLSDETAPSAQELAHSVSPRIVLSPVCTRVPEDPVVTKGVASARRSSCVTDQEQQTQTDCVLEVLLKDLEVAFVSEKPTPDKPFQQQRPRFIFSGRPGFGSAMYSGRVDGEGEGTAEAPAGLDQPADISLEPFRVVASLRDCVIRSADGSRLLQNASCVPKLFSGAFSTGAHPSGPGIRTPQLHYPGASGPSQGGGGNATPTGTQGNSHGGAATARRQQQKARLSVTGLMPDVALQDPLLQSLVWVSDGAIFVSGEVAYLRIQLRAMQAAAVYSWGVSLFGAMQQLKHFRLQFPAISFGCCFSTASWLPPVGISKEQLVRISQLQSRGTSPAMPHQLHPENAADQAVRRSLLLQQRGLGILCLLYPSVPPFALSPESWHGYLHLQQPETAPPVPIQQVLQALEAEATAREAAAATSAAAEVAAGPPPWRLQTADLFQHHTDLGPNVQPSPSGLRTAYERSPSPTREPRAASGEGWSARRPLGRSVPVADARGTAGMPQPATYQQPRRPSASDALSVSSYGDRRSPGLKQPESSAARVKKTGQGFWSWLGGCLCCRRRRIQEASSAEATISQGTPGTSKHRVTGFLRSLGSSLSGTSSASLAHQMERHPELSPSGICITGARVDRKRTSALSTQPSLIEGPYGRPRPMAVSPLGPPKPPAAAPSPHEAAILGAKLQKVVEMTIRGVEVWFVVGATDGADASAQFSADGKQAEALSAANIASLKTKRKSGLKSLAAMTTPKSPDKSSEEENPNQRIEGQPLSRSLMQVLLTAANRKGLCVEEESPDDRRKHQIVIGLLAACTLRLLQRGPDVNICGEVVELSAMVGSPIPCNEFVVSKPQQTLRQGSLGRPLAQQHPDMLLQQQQRGTVAPNSRSVKQLPAPTVGQPSDIVSLDQQQPAQRDEEFLMFCNFPDILEGYGGALLLPNLQQRTDCLLSVAPSTATISASVSARSGPASTGAPFVIRTGTPGGKAKICVTISDPQVHFSFEMFQGLVSLETQARLEQLQVSRAAAAATTAMKAAVAAAAAAADADAAALVQAPVIRDGELHASAGASVGRVQQPQSRDTPPFSSTNAWPCSENIPKVVLPAGSDGGGGGFGGCSGSSSVGGAVASPSSAGGGAAPGGSPMAVRVTNYSVAVGDISMEGSLLYFVRNYICAIRDAAGPGAQQRQRPLFGWTPAGGDGSEVPDDERSSKPAIVGAMELLRLHQQRRCGALGRALEELNAISGTSQQPPDEAISALTSSTSSTSSESPLRPEHPVLQSSLSWGAGDRVLQQQQQEELQMSLQRRQASPPQSLQQPAASMHRNSREPIPYGVGDEEAVASAELLLLANLMAAGSHVATKTNVYGEGAQRADGVALQQPHHQHVRMGSDSEAADLHSTEPPNTSLGEQDADGRMPMALLQGVEKADFKDPYCRVIGLFLTLLSFKIPGETELEIKGEVVKGAFEFHDAHGSLLKVSMLTLEGQVYIHPELWSPDSVKKFGGRLEVMVSGYDPMTNSQEELLHPVAASVEIQRQYVDPQTSHWSLVNIRSAMDGVSVDITSGLLQLVYHIVRTTHEILQGAEGSLGRHTSLRVYNDIHSDVLVMHRRRTRDEPRGWSYSRMQPDEWILAPTASLYFAVRKHSAADDTVPEKRRGWRRGAGSHQKLDEAHPTLRLDSYEEVKHVVEGLLQLGTNKEETLLFSCTRKAQAPLEMLVDDMPVLQAGGNATTRHGWEGLLQLLRKEPGWCCLGRLHADYSNCRAYFLQNAGFKVLVEPVVNRRTGTWSLAVGSCVQLANACSMTLRVYMGRIKRNWGGRAISCFAARVTGENRANGGPEEYIDIFPGCRRSVPLSWFGNGTMPSLAALLHTEDGGTGEPGNANPREGGPEIPPVAFPALYKLTNKTGYAHPRRLDIPPFTLRLRGSLMLYGVVDTTDVPTSEASRIAQRYVIKLEPMLSIKNTLPFPITVSVYLRNTVESRHAHETGSGAAPGAVASGVSAGHDSSLYASSIEAGRYPRHAFGNAQAGLLAELETLKRQKQEAQQRKSRGTAAKLVSNRYVEATIPSHQSWGLPVGEQRLWLVLRVHGAPLEQFSTQLEAFNPTDGRPLGPLELQLLASAASRGGGRLGGAAWLLQQETADSAATRDAAGQGKVAFAGEGRNAKLQHRKQQRPQPQQPTTVYESQRFAVLLPTQDTVTVSKVLQLKDGRGESLLPPGALKVARADAMNQRRGRKPTPLFSEMQLAADVSRRQITVFAPYFFENLTEATLWVNGALVPSRCRLYTTEEDMRAASIRAYKVDVLADRVLQSSLSRKHDLTGISTARPPLVLKLAAMRKQRGIRFAWGNRANSANKDEPRQSPEATGGPIGSGDSVVSSSNAGGGGERLPGLGCASDLPRETSQGDSPSFKPTPSSTDSFVDEETLGQLPFEKRLRFNPKRPASAFGGKRHLSDAPSGGGELEDEVLKSGMRPKSFRVTVQRRVQKLGGGRRGLLRKKDDVHGFDSSGADSGEKEGLFGADTGDVTLPAGGDPPAPSAARRIEPGRSNSSDAPHTLVLGVCTRYGDAPYSTSKIVSVVPRYMFISRLPFPVVVREVRSRSRVLGGAMGGRTKVTPCELPLLPGETKAFHGVEPKVLLTHAANTLVSCSFSLVPAHVPSFFQVEMTPRGRGAKVYLPEHCTIVQVSIVSGLFGDVPALPYTYNGSFIVLSLPEHPQFAILNLTSYFLAHAPAERSRRTQQNQLRDDAFAIPITSGTQIKSSTKKGRDDSDSSLRLIPPWGPVPFIPPYHKNLENTRVRLRVLDVEHCPWSVYSLASVDEDLQTIEFIPRQPQQTAAGASSPQTNPRSPRSTDGATARKIPLLQRLPTKSLVTAANAAAAVVVPSITGVNTQQQVRGYPGVTYEGYFDTVEDPNALQDADMRLSRPQTPRGGQSAGSSSKEKQSATLYVSSIVAASGSRILIVAEERQVAEKLRGGGSAFDTLRQELGVNTTRDDGTSAAANAAPATALCDPAPVAEAYKASGAAGGYTYISERQKALGTPSGGVDSPDASSGKGTSLAKEPQRKSLLQEERRQRPPPWLGLSFEFRLPRLTVTWIHQSEVVLALHLTGLSLSGSVSPRQLDSFLEAVPLEQVLWKRSGSIGAHAERAPALEAGDPSTNSASPMGSTGTEGPVEDEGIDEISLRSAGPTRGSATTLAGAWSEEREPEHLTLQQQVHQEDYAILVMTRSAVSLSASISMLHVDHFVKGDIPVILKNTASKYGKETEEFLEVAVVRSLVDPRQAPTYELLEVRISPFSANIELLVIEQLIRIYEKEVEMLHKFAVAAPHKPPALQTALKCSDAADALRHLAVIDVLERSRHEDRLAAETTAGGAKTIAPGRGGGASEGGSGGTAAAAAAAFLTHSLAFDLAHPGSCNPSRPAGSTERLWHVSSTCGPSGLSASKDFGPGESRSLDSYQELLLREPVAIQFYASPRVYINPPSSHVLVMPNPRWMELHRASPVYIKNLTISSLSLTVSIRTSEHRISRQVLHIVDALPLDTPYMAIQIARERRKFTVCSWHELLHSLRNSYLRQFIRQSLPSAWISNPCAFVVGFLRGTVALFRQTIKGAKTSHNSFEGLMTGFRVGFILFIIYTMGGIMQSLSHVLNILHKLMRGSRPRPYGVLDAFWKGLNGLLLDTFWRPWVAVVTEPTASATRGDSWWKTTAILLACCVRCLISPLFGLSNFLASVAEGFANTLIGDFEQFTRVQERADLDKKHKHPATGGVLGGSDGATGAPGRGASRATDTGGGPGYRDPAVAGAGLGSRFRRGKRKSADKPGAKPDAVAGTAAPSGFASAGKQLGGGSFTNAFRRGSSKQVTFAV